MVTLIGSGPYWRIVEQCLVQFHSYDAAEAAGRVRDFQARIPEDELGDERSLVYHPEPFDVACSLARHPIDRAAVNREYLSIVERIAVATNRQLPRRPGLRACASAS